MNDFFKMIRDFLKVYLAVMRKNSKNTISSYQSSLNLFLDFVAENAGIDFSNISFETITYETVRAYVEFLDSHGVSASTINVRLSAIRSFYEYASIADHSLTFYRKEVEKVPLRKVNAKSRSLEFLDRGQVAELLRAPDNKTDIGFRDMLIMMLMYDAALRVSELINIRIKDVHDGNASYVEILGKRNKFRNVPVSPKTSKAIKIYLEKVHKDTKSENYLFYPSGTYVDRPMSVDNVNRIIKKYANKTDSIRDPNSVHCHMLRHSRAVHLRQGGMPLPILSEFLGHSDMETTLIYASADVDMKAKAIQKALGKDDSEVEKPNDPLTDFKKMAGLK